MFSSEDVKLFLVPTGAFNKFNLLLAEHITNQIHLGRNLKDDFLYPIQKADDDIIVPIMTKQISPRKKITYEKSISVLYFTDPICSTCWIIQPQLRKLQLEYKEHVNIEYKMGGYSLPGRIIIDLVSKTRAMWLPIGKKYVPIMKCRSTNIFGLKIHYHRLIHHL